MLSVHPAVFFDKLDILKNITDIFVISLLYQPFYIKNLLTHCGLVMSYGGIDLLQHQLR